MSEGAAWHRLEYLATVADQLSKSPGVYQLAGREEGEGTRHEKRVGVVGKDKSGFEPGGHQMVSSRELDQVAELRRILESKDQEIASLKQSAGRTHSGNIRPENIVWMFGSGRTGSNWLMSMIGNSAGCARWEEPRIGSLFAFYYSNPGQHSNKHFILG
jgi:hypothetical protein